MPVKKFIYTALALVMFILSCKKNMYHPINLCLTSLLLPMFTQ
jgi:hypothetical protein